MLRSRVLLLLAAAPLVAASCAGNSAQSDTESTATPVVVDTTTTSPTANGAAFVPPGYESLVTPDGRTRSYRVVDLSVDGPAPLLLVLHGFGGNAEAMRSYTGVEAAVAPVLEAGAVVVYPNGTGLEQGLPQSWNAGGCCPFSIYEPVDDVAFLERLVDELLGRYDIDTGRIWAIGHSNGGMMAYRLACESSRISAIGVAAGALMVESCSPGREVSLLHLHGELDAVVPLAGGEIAGITFPSARASFETFAAADGCAVVDSDGTCPGGAVLSLRTDPLWTHDWQPEWTTSLLGFLSERG